MAKINLGTKPEKSECIPSKMENKIRYPGFYVDKELPFEGDDVGKTVKAVVTLRLSSYSERNDKTGQNCSYNFDVQDIEFVDKKLTAKAEENAGKNLKKVFG